MTQLKTETGKLRSITVSLDNRPGALAEAARVLADEQINVEAHEAEILGKYGFFRFYTKDYDHALAVLKNKGYITTTAEIVEVILTDRPGELARCCETLAKAKVNVESAFGSTVGGVGACRTFLRVSDAVKAHQALVKAGFEAHRVLH